MFHILIFRKFLRFRICIFLRIRFLHIIVGLIILLPARRSTAQDSVSVNSIQTINQPSDIIVELSPVLISVNRDNPSFGGGLNLQYYISKRVNLNGYLVISGKYGHFNLGIISVPLLIAFESPEGIGSENLEEFLLQLLLLVTVFENPSFHIPLNASTDFSVYAGVLRFIFDERNIPAGSTDNNSFLACYFGLRLNRYFGRFVLTPYGEVSFRYRDFSPSVNAGLHLGYLIPGK